MRVGIVTHEFPPFIFGGIGTFSHNLAEALAKQGLDVLVIAGSPAKYPELTRSGELGILRLPRGPLPPRHLWFQLRNLSAIKRELSACDVIHGQDSAAFPLLACCKRSGLRVPWVVTFHTNPFAQMRLALASIRQGASLSDLMTYLAGFPLWDAAVRSHAKFADRLVSVSKSLQGELSDTYRIEHDRMDVVHTCVDMAHLRKLTGDRGSASPSGINLLYAGRLYYGKGITHLLTITQLLVQHLGVANFHLQIFGRGPLEKTLRRYVSLNGLARLVTFHGHVPHDTLLRNLARSDIVCFPSLYEACPLLMIEAMGLAKPIVAFDLPFAREMLGENCSMLLAADNVDFARKLSRLISCEDDRHQVGHILESRAADYDAMKIASLYRKIYTAALS